MYYPNVTEYCFFLGILFAHWIYLHWALYQEYLNIRNLNNLIVLTELFPTPDLKVWRITLYIYIYIYISGAEMGLVLLVPGMTNNSVNVIQNGLKIIH